MISAAVTSLLAGSVAGAVGVGVAFPFDTLKTKQQVLAYDSVSQTRQNLNMLQVIKKVYHLEGIGGFFGGVRGMMLGQAVIKSVAFGTNAMALGWFQQHTELPLTMTLLAASCIAGFFTSFLVVPVERVKVLMQASSAYANEFDCLKAIVRAEGCGGLMGRGLGTTLAREIPSYAIYFGVYGLLMGTPWAAAMGKLAPLVFGAMSGCACWLPVYPIDVVKTFV
jgi:hypothetical protein